MEVSTYSSALELPRGSLVTWPACGADRSSEIAGRRIQGLGFCGLDLGFWGLGLRV